MIDLLRNNKRREKEYKEGRKRRKQKGRGYRNVTPVDILRSLNHDHQATIVLIPNTSTSQQNSVQSGKLESMMEAEITYHPLRLLFLCL